MANNINPADVAAAEAAFRAGEAAERVYEDAYSAHPGIGMDADAAVRDVAGQYNSARQDEVPQPPAAVQYVDPAGGSGGRFGGS